MRKLNFYSTKISMEVFNLSAYTIVDQVYFSSGVGKVLLMDKITRWLFLCCNLVNGFGLGLDHTSFMTQIVGCLGTWTVMMESCDSWPVFSPTTTWNIYTTCSAMPAIHFPFPSFHHIDRLGILKRTEFDNYDELVLWCRPKVYDSALWRCKMTSFPKFW